MSEEYTGFPEDYVPVIPYSITATLQHQQNTTPFLSVSGGSQDMANRDTSPSLQTIPPPAAGPIGGEVPGFPANVSEVPLGVNEVPLSGYPSYIEHSTTKQPSTPVLEVISSLPASLEHEQQKPMPPTFLHPQQPLPSLQQATQRVLENRALRGASQEQPSMQQQPSYLIPQLFFNNRPFQNKPGSGLRPPSDFQQQIGQQPSLQQSGSIQQQQMPQVVTLSTNTPMAAPPASPSVQVTEQSWSTGGDSYTSLYFMVRKQPLRSGDFSRTGQ
jgi:hypothetical protein